MFLGPSGLGLAKGAPVIIPSSTQSGNLIGAPLRRGGIRVTNAQSTAPVTTEIGAYLLAIRAAHFPHCDDYYSV